MCSLHLVDVVLADDTVVQPDLLGAPKDASQIGERCSPLLLVEVLSAHPVRLI